MPQTVAHRIDKTSPLYNLGQKELLNSKFEMLVTLEGIVEPTGNSLQIRSSYLPNEILWAHRFETMVNYSKKRGTYVVDCSCLNAVLPDNTPGISRKNWEEKRQLDELSMKRLKQSTNMDTSITNGKNVSRVKITETPHEEDNNV